MISMSRVIRYAAGLAIVLAMSAQVAQAAPDHLTWKGEQVGPKHGPMVATQTFHRNELVLGSTVHQPSGAVIRVTDAGGGSGFDWTAASLGAASVVGIVLIAGGAATGIRSRRRVAIP